MLSVELNILIEQYLDAAWAYLQARRASESGASSLRPTLKTQYASWQEFTKDRAAIGAYNTREARLDSKRYQAQNAEGVAEDALQELLPSGIWFKYGEMAIGRTDTYDSCVLVDFWHDDMPPLTPDYPASIKTEEQLLGIYATYVIGG